MAKSIYEILDSLETETSIGNGETVEHTLPRELLPTAEEFESEEKLLEWATECECLHGVLQRGVQKFLIDLRAIFKAHKKDETWSIGMGQKNVNNAKWSVIKRPKQGGIAKAKAEAELEAGVNIAKAMITNGVNDEMVLASLIPVYGENLANTILEQVKEVVS